MQSTVEQITIGIGLYLSVCAISTLSGFGLIRLLRLEATAADVLLAPIVTLVFWTLGTGVAGGLRMPIQSVTGWLWGATLALAIYGLIRLCSRLRRVDLLWILCTTLPMLTMGCYFTNGLTNYLGSVLPDGWSYIALGQYLWEYPRGTVGGLAPLYQYAAHLSNTRFIAAAMLGFFSPLVHAGDTQTVSSLFQAWGLNTIACAVAFFLVTAKYETPIVVTATALSVVSGWTANLVWANNFDNELALVYMPALAGIILILNERDWRWWFLSGGLIASIWYTYPELAIVTMAGVAVIALPRLWVERDRWRSWLKGVGLAIVVAFLFLLPLLGTLFTFIQMQFAATVSGGARPGEGVFGGLVSRQFLPAAFWGLGGEHQFESYRDLLNVGGFTFLVLEILGLFRLWKEKHWGLVTTCLFLTLGTVYYIFLQRYSYGAYKLLIVNWWCLAIALTVGAEWVLGFPFRQAWRPGRVTGLTLLTGMIVANVLMHELYFRNLALDARCFRQINIAKQLAMDKPIQVLVDDWIANEWAVYYLRDIPIDLGAYRMYMAQAHVVPFMQGATLIDPDTIHYLLTDARFEQEAQNGGWQKMWSGGPYTLWLRE